MRITIDSSDSLDDALRVVGALYGVTIGAAATPAGGTDEEAAGQSDSVIPAAANARAKGRRSRASGSKRSSTPVTAVVRSWAREHGHEVSDRGRVSNAVLEAYRNDAAAT